MSEQFRGRIEVGSERQHHRGECMPRRVECHVLFDFCLLCQFRVYILDTLNKEHLVICIPVVSVGQLVLLFAPLYLLAGNNQCTHIGQRRNTQRFIHIDKLAVGNLLKPKAAHTGVVIDTRQEIK